jgi:hypothetical protein
MPKPLNESSNSNQSKTPYEFNNRKSGFFSKFGSAAIAVGSLATALSIAVPSVGAYVGETVTSAFGISPATGSVTDTQPTAAKTGTTSEAAILGGQAASSGSTSAATAPTAVISTNALTGAVAVDPNLPTNQAALPTSTTAATSSAATAPVTTPPATKTPAAAALPDLTPVDAGNVSSPTPGGGSSESYGPSTGASGTASATGNTSYVDDDDDDDDDHDDDDDDDHDDDDDDDDDDDHDDD